ncbi:toxin-antitoxin system HicB family antitoxin [Sphingobium sp. B1D7B]|uniref:toxin-antitoxin system HicB family antitoxin n=1 Tax=Sphingobium sp. B1D7B TaxID=2940578 RepID=UPI002225AB7D|nr:toxin-antitoxin system HicB family antitoxin [Sphingobium sp. B1D7B]
MPASVTAAAARLAKEDGVSLNQWISVAMPRRLAWSRRHPVSSSAGRARLGRRTYCPFSTNYSAKRRRARMRYAEVDGRLKGWAGAKLRS